MNEEDVVDFLEIRSQLKSAYDEISLLSKKKPSDVLNKFKIKFINSILMRANELLEDSYMPFPDEFSRFDEDDLPNNGDAVFMLSHYLTSLEQLRCDNIRYVDYNYFWVIDNKRSNIKTTSPTNK